jgi:uncharacterized protein (TIGR01777 family)
MALFEKRSLLDTPIQDLFRWHQRPQAFQRLAPPWDNIRIVEKRGGIQNGDRVVLEIKQGPFWRRWVAIHRDYIEGKQFIDEQVEGPFAKWVHTHQFEPETDKTSWLQDHVEYEPPFGFLGRFVAGGYIARKVARIFQFRHGRTSNDLKRGNPYSKIKPMKIGVTGASGMVGTELMNFLSCLGHEVRPMVRRAAYEGEVHWDPSKKEMDRSGLEGLDAVIHLAGENIGAGRWNADRKRKIKESRIAATQFLAESLASLKDPPKVFIASSAIGFYGNRGEEVLNEQSPAGMGFLAEVCQDWERACEPARKAGIRTVNIRTGIVLSAKGGALPKMVLSMLMGAGGVIGSGKQWMSWISMEDLVGIFHYAIHQENLSGSVNATAPGAVTNASLTKVLGKVLCRPTLAPLPGFVVKTIFGEMGESLLLEGQQVKPEKLTKAGFEFFYPDLESALRWELGR